jgi:hypothetical protein
MKQIATTLLFRRLHKAASSMILIVGFMLSMTLMGHLSAQNVFGIYPWPFGDGDDVVKYNLNPNTNTWDYVGIAGTTGLNVNVSLAFNTRDKKFYLIGGDDYDVPRNLYRLNSSTFEADELLTQLISTNGNTKPNAFAISPAGEVFIAYANGRIDKFDLNTMQPSFHAHVTPTGGAAGLTYDFDNNRLIYARGDSPVVLSEVLSDGTVNEFFSFYTPGERDDCSAQAMAYLGNGVILASSTYGCDLLYSIDLNSQTPTLIGQPNGSPYESIKSFALVALQRLFKLEIKSASQP